jgi:hypothetical protein
MLNASVWASLIQRHAGIANVTPGTDCTIGTLGPATILEVNTMSVISSVPTAEGFVIGSDGRSSVSDPPRILSDDVQKIFSVDRRGVKLAYGLFGTIRIGDAMDNFIFDFETEIVKAVEAIGRRTIWANYLAALGAHIEKSLNDARRRSNNTYQNDDSLTAISLGGYFERSQKCGHLRFHHAIDTTTCEAKAYVDGFSFPWAARSEIVELIDSRDPRFLRFADPPRFGLATLASGIDRVRNDIAAYSDPEAYKFDETLRWRIGGRVQIATLTLADGFRWVAGFEPAQKQPNAPEEDL